MEPLTQKEQTELKEDFDGTDEDYATALQNGKLVSGYGRDGLMSPATYHNQNEQLLKYPRFLWESTGNAINSGMALGGYMLDGSASNIPAALNALAPKGSAMDRSTAAWRDTLLDAAEADFSSIKDVIRPDKYSWSPFTGGANQAYWEDSESGVPGTRTGVGFFDDQLVQTNPKNDRVHALTPRHKLRGRMGSA
jgi:hypothetical protein